jgi:hypothetical protein
VPALRRCGIVATAIALTGCTTIQRWSAVSGLPPSSPPDFTVTSAPADAPGGAVTAKDLPDRAGAAYIAALASRDKSAADLRADVAKPIKSPASGISDGSVVPRVLLVTVERPHIRPGDRLLMTRVLVRPANADVSFTDYQFAATERATINIGTVSVSDSLGGSAGIGPGPAAGASLLPNASISASRSRSASRNIDQEAIFSVSTQPHQIEIFRTGAEDRDLLGNTLIKVSLRFGSLNGAPIYYLTDAAITDDKTGAPLDANQASISLNPLALYEPQDVWVCATMAYEDREVIDPRSEDEGRQKAIIATGATAERPYLIVPYQDLQQLLWKIRDADGSHIAFADGLTLRDLSFDDYAGAEQFLAWLRIKRPTTIKNGRLVINIGAMAAPITRYDRLSLELLRQTVGSPGNPPDCTRK